MYKPIILAIMIIFCLSFVSAKYLPVSERISLEKEQTVEFNGKRITLLNLDFEKERALVCVNGEKAILINFKTETVNDAILRLKKVTMNRAEISIRVNCPGCECDETCDNSVCFDECLKDDDCDDGNDLTENECYGNPKRCHYEKTKECTIAEHCDDNDGCTLDKCSEELKKCIHTEKIECKEEKLEVNNKVTADSTVEIEDYARNLNPLLISITLGIMIVTLAIKKFKF